MTKQDLLATPSTSGSRIGEPFRWLRNEVDRLFDDFDPGTRLFQWRQPSFPALAMEELDNSYHLTAEVPGYDQDQIQMTIADGYLILKGERSSEERGEENGLMFSERHEGRFERRIALPGRFDPDKIDAKLEKGVLDISVPKIPDPEQRTIPIKTV